MMATITRSFQDFRKNIGIVQTTHNWIIEVYVEQGKLNKFNKAKIEFRTGEIEGCPPETDGEVVPVQVGGFTFNYYGKTKKDGEIGFSAYEDVTGAVGDLAREINRIWGKGVDTTTKPDKATLIGDSAYFAGGKDVRFKLIVKLADNAGNVTKQWIFYDATAKSSPEGSLGQETDTFKYKFTFNYSMFEEKGVGGDTW
jgi:hypothetical protein